MPSTFGASPGRVEHAPEYHMRDRTHDRYFQVLPFSCCCDLAQPAVPELEQVCEHCLELRAAARLCLELIVGLPFRAVGNGSSFAPGGLKRFQKSAALTSAEEALELVGGAVPVGDRPVESALCGGALDDASLVRVRNDEPECLHVHGRVAKRQGRPRNRFRPLVGAYGFDMGIVAIMARRRKLLNGTQFTSCQGPKNLAQFSC
jgi:hypothetical protein